MRKRKPYLPSPGADYRACISKLGTMQYSRMGGKTWEYLCPSLTDGDIPFRTFKEQNGWIPMRLFVGPYKEVWLVRQNKHYRATLNHKLVAEGTQAELWPLFLAHVRMLG